MPTSFLSSKGQITLPKAVREALNLHAGDQVDFVLCPDGQIEVRKVGGRVRELLGLYRADRPTVDPTSDDVDFNDHLAADDERIRRQR